MKTDILNISSYRFVQLDDLEALADFCRQWAASTEMMGTIILAPEGINVNLAGTEANVRRFCEYLTSIPAFHGMQFKESWSAEVPYRRFVAKIKPEIITFKEKEADPLTRTGKHMPPKELKAWLDANKEITILDTRNEYEMRIGKFKDAINLHIDKFTELPEKVKELPEEMKEKPMLMYCTGGVRCEKAVFLMEDLGFKDVYQLDGGILKYFEECGGAHYEGECFVFDGRAAVDPNLEETDTTICLGCGEPLLPHEQVDSPLGPCRYCPK